MNANHYWQNGLKKRRVIDGYMVEVKKVIENGIIVFLYQ